VLQSTFGRANKSDLATYDISDRGLIELCASRNDLAVVLDEQGRNEGGRDHIRKIAFTVAGGRGKILSEKAARDLGLSNLTWRLFAMTSGEEPLENAHQRRAQGERVRHIDIKIPDREEGGIFNQLKGSRQEKAQQAQKLAAQVEAAIGANFGVAMRRYISKLVAERDSLKPELQEMVSDFITTAGADTDAWERRFALKFAIVAAGLAIAARFGCAPIAEERARPVVMRVYRLARRSVFSTQELTKDVLRRIRDKVQDKTRFPRIEKGESLASGLRQKAWGFRRTHPRHGLIIAVNPARFERMAGSRAAAEAVFDLLSGQGVAICGTAGKRRLQIAVQGFERTGRARWVCLHAGNF
jgi:hypothetical protein